MKMADTLTDLNTIFKKQTITSYGFTRLLMAKLSLSNKATIYKNSFVSRVYALAQKTEYAELINDIGFKVSIDSVVSPEINTAIATMQSFGMIAEHDSMTGEILILINDTMACKIISEYTIELSQIMDLFIDDLIKEGEE